MNLIQRNTTLAAFLGMFFWWALIVLYCSMRWEGIIVYLIGLLPALGLCLITAWGIDRFRILESWQKRATIGWGLNIVTYIIWIIGTKNASSSRGIEFGSDGPFMVGGWAILLNLLFLLIVQAIGAMKKSH